MMLTTATASSAVGCLFSRFHRAAFADIISCLVSTRSCAGFCCHLSMSPRRCSPWFPQQRVLCGVMVALHQVIDHFEGRGSAEVGNEARMLISLSHDNIVKAFSFLTCSWVPNSSLGGTRSSVSQLLTGWESQQQQQQQQPILTAASGAAACASSAQHQPLQQGQQLKQAPMVPPAKPPAHPATGSAGGGPLAPPTAGSSQSSTCISMATGQQRGSGLLAGSVKPAAGAGQGVSAAAIMDPFLQAPGQEANASSTCRAPACTSNALTAVVCEQQMLPFVSEVTGLMQDTSDSSSNNQQPAAYSARTWMVTEYCDGGPMLEALHKLQEVLSPTSQEFMVSFSAADGLPAASII